MTTSRTRFYPGSHVGEQLCDWLNSPRATKKVVRLFSDLCDVMQVGGPFTAWVDKPPQVKAGDIYKSIVWDEETPENPLGYHVRQHRVTELEAERFTAKYGRRQRRELWARLERELRSYSFVPELDQWINMWSSVKSRSGRRLSFHWRSRNGQEGMAVLWILELLGIGRLSRVRRCQQCSKWFFSAVKEDGKFCSVKCQRSFSSSKEEAREQHREYMRVWRDRKACGKEQSKQSKKRGKR
jgi:hypothetical protein